MGKRDRSACLPQPAVNSLPPPTSWPTDDLHQGPCVPTLSFILEESKASPLYFSYSKAKYSFQFFFSFFWVLKLNNIQEPQINMFCRKNHHSHCVLEIFFSIVFWPRTWTRKKDNILLSFPSVRVGFSKCHHSSVGDILSPSVNSCPTLTHSDAWWH